MGPTSYRTIARDGEVELEVKRSRFRCTLERVADEGSARAVVERLRKQHWDARHHCSAFVLGPDAGLTRSSDDGEPSGTAGQPMLDVLRGTGLANTTVVVTRYFGGTLLGTGGLVRAYSEATAQALQAAARVTLTRLHLWDLRVPVAQAGRIEAELRSRNPATASGPTAEGGTTAPAPATVIRITAPPSPAGPPQRR